MGGYNSMEAWVNANPPLALMDYTHPSVQGADKIGDLIAQALIKAYKDFK
jgi:lysophospholipase L1-like esterase